MSYTTTFFILGLLIGLWPTKLKIKNKQIFLAKLFVIFSVSTIFYLLGSLLIVYFKGGWLGEYAAWAILFIIGWTFYGLFGLILGWLIIIFLRKYFKHSTK